MGYIINRDITMALYGAAVFAVVFAVHVLFAKLRRKRISGKPYLTGAVLCAAWEYIYSAGSWWKHNNGLLGAYLMIAVPVTGVVCCVVLSWIIGSKRIGKTE